MINKNSSYESFRQLLLEHIQGKRFQPCGEKALFSRLKISPQFYQVCRQILIDLVKEKIVVIRKRQYLLNKPKADTVRGIIHLHPKGFGFVEPDHPSSYTQDIFIPKHLTKDCIDQDHVEVEVDPNSDWTKGPEGKVLNILERKRTHVGAILHHSSPNDYFFAYAPLLGSSKMILVQPLPNSQIGHRVVLKMTDWGSQSSPPTAEIIQTLGCIDDPSIDVNCAVQEFNLSSEFSAVAVEEAKSFGKEVSHFNPDQRTDLRGLACVTIDPKTAKDFDDALSLEIDTNGYYHLGVHIADVAYYVPVNSHLDHEAQHRGNSTYFPGSCIPMLPHELSDHLCSLKPHVDRLTISVMMDFTPEGQLLKTSIQRGIIQSRHRFSYEEARLVLDGKEKSPYLFLLQNMAKLALLLKTQRNARGSIDFSLPDLHIVVDKKGNPLGLHLSEYDITHQLVEEFMLKANEVVALHLIEKKSPSIFRVHESPSPSDQEDFYKTVRSLGFFLPPEPVKEDIQKVFAQAKETPYAHQLAVSFIRSMKLAQYSSKQETGHYGLSLSHYCHFTSPIRRYSDLVVQRLLCDEEAKDKNFEDVAKLCSEHERLSFRAESSVKLLKKFRLLKKWNEENPSATYEATITKIKPFGICFDIKDLLIEGFIHISELENDYFLFNTQKNCLIGERSGQIHQMGDTIKVTLISLDLILLETKWELFLPTGLKRKPKKKTAKNPVNKAIAVAKKGRKKRK